MVVIGGDDVHCDDGSQRLHEPPRYGGTSYPRFHQLSPTRVSLLSQLIY